ncbi:hypothetical protein GQ55_8G115500 [Panicum hallii var. hallii]|uniref:Uncharacterized protein n=2 Tax=Panicum hallii TaxID=206008 RepID=A0A2T7CMJ5_9POAL|nr:hypothetical protein GQ55_8G115500 [Panicum hallii var. hallii]PVH34013.1 hypothetical protein PAHAL_8G119300 [Panicum hallii]
MHQFACRIHETTTHQNSLAIHAAAASYIYKHTLRPQHEHLLFRIDGIAREGGPAAPTMAAEAVRSQEASSAAVLAAHRTTGGNRKAAMTMMSESVSTGARVDGRVRGGGVPAVAARGSCKVEASARGPGEGGDGGSGGGAAFLVARRNAASRRLLPRFVSCVVV